jgi:hypothetical protein
MKMISDENIAVLLSFPMEERLDQYFPEGYLTEEESTDTDVAWHALHFLLTKTLEDGDAPSSYLLVGGTVIGPSVFAPSRDNTTSTLGEVDRVLGGEDVYEFNEYLSTITDREFRQRYNELMPAMADVYPGIWNKNPEQDIADLHLSFHALKDFVNKVSERNLGLLFHFA